MNTVKLFATIVSICALSLGATGVYAGGEHGEHHHDEKKAAQEKPHDGPGSHEHGGHDDGGHDHGAQSSPTGAPASAAEVSKTIRVTMLDSMRYEFGEFPGIHRNEVVRFVVTNRGKIRHEFSIGNAEEQREHAQMMREMPDMVHRDGNTLSLGRSSRLRKSLSGFQRF